MSLAIISFLYGFLLFIVNFYVIAFLLRKIIFNLENQGNGISSFVVYLLFFLKFILIGIIIFISLRYLFVNVVFFVVGSLFAFLCISVFYLLIFIIKKSC